MNARMVAVVTLRILRFRRRRIPACREGQPGLRATNQVEPTRTTGGFSR
jgi:hypothetical protein